MENNVSKIGVDMARCGAEGEKAENFYEKQRRKRWRSKRQKNAHLLKIDFYKSPDSSKPMHSPISQS
jgi:hypothetical protein